MDCLTTRKIVLMTPRSLATTFLLYSASEFIFTLFCCFVDNIRNQSRSRLTFAAGLENLQRSVVNKTVNGKQNCVMS